jgi:D-beta-D-heptose 7-phosphate kinase/D-beta-D-heptose 1-phosphate adenosyltransferase
VERALKTLKERVETSTAMVTLGSGGLAWLDEAGRFHSVEAHVREVFDITGAGDTVIATLAAFLSAGCGLSESMGLANVAGGVSVGRVGAVAVNRSEILDRLANRPSSPARKTLDRSDVPEWIGRKRAKDLSVVFTNGCFDLLHRGHVEYLSFCREQGELLIVGLNSDRSVRALKGPGRPLNTAADRAAVLGALESVDAVVIFDEETPAAIIGEVGPDVLVKGEDWREKGVVGREFVESRGGKVILAPLAQGHSTSALIQKLEPPAPE